MLTLVVFEFPYTGPWGADMSAATQGLALWLPSDRLPRIRTQERSGRTRRHTPCAALS